MGVAVGVGEAGVGHRLAHGPVDDQIAVQGTGCGRPIEVGRAVKVAGDDDGAVGISQPRRKGFEDAADFGAARLLFGRDQGCGAGVGLADIGAEVGQVVDPQGVDFEVAVGAER